MTGNLKRKVAIIITTFNQELLLEKCLESIKEKTDYKNYKVFLIDDGSTNRIGSRIKKKFNWVDTTINSKNLGFSKANNIGIKKALRHYNPDYVLLLNDDAEVIQRDWLKNMIAKGEKDENSGILGCKIIYPDGSLQNMGGYIKGWEITKLLKTNKRLVEVDHVMGAFMLIKRKVIEKIGLLDEIYSPYLLEDTDYCLKAKKAGFLVKSVSYVKIIHKKGKTIDSLKNKKVMFVRFKNDIIFSARHLAPRNALFRMCIYLPMVAMFKKIKDEAELKPENFRLRLDFPINLLFLISAYFYAMTKINKI
jgi:GT2 family glycosyltransferase